MRRLERSPARVLTPRDERREAMAILLNTAGGVCGGDQLSTEVRLLPGAEASLAGQTAERIYRAYDRPARLDVHLQLDDGAALHWAPQETILFDGSRLVRRTELHAHPGSRFLAAETLVLGRRAMGETIHRLHLNDDLRIYRSDRMVFADSLRFSGDPERALQSPEGLGGSDALSTVVAQGFDLKRACDSARDLLAEASEELLSGATLLGDLLVVRLVGAGAALRSTLIRLLEHLRGQILGFDSGLPRVWFC